MKHMRQNGMKQIAPLIYIVLLMFLMTGCTGGSRWDDFDPEKGAIGDGSNDVKIRSEQAQKDRIKIQKGKEERGKQKK